MNIKKTIFLFLGTISLAIGFIGIFLPLIPTTPLVLLAAFFYSNSSKKAEKWLMKSKYFKSYIENYRNNVGVPKNVKIRSILFLWIVIAISLFFTINSYFKNNSLSSLIIIIILLIVVICVTIHIYSLKTKE
ncbi:MAG: YbaN family protein [Methanobrevibacter sp.]|jgi:uncharacterized membrane protein YbaN (DUF454 family)|nr:YbaN family protein [Candidatus Methanoflexus mossambicus]